MYAPPRSISEVVSEYLNRTTFLPVIKKEFVWETHEIEKLFDSIMEDFSISTFLFWKVDGKTKEKCAAYEFIREFDPEIQHNREVPIAGINQDIYLVLDGQQRLTSLFIGLKGSYRYFYYRWHEYKLYLNILKAPVTTYNPEEFTYQFQFRENDTRNPKDPNPQYWYLVSDILKFGDAKDSWKETKERLKGFTNAQRGIANSHIKRLHSRICTSRLLNYYEEKSQDYEKVVKAFVRATI